MQQLGLIVKLFPIAFELLLSIRERERKKKKILLGYFGCLRLELRCLAGSEPKSKSVFGKLFVIWYYEYS